MANTTHCAGELLDGEGKSGKLERALARQIGKRTRPACATRASRLSAAVATPPWPLSLSVTVKLQPRTVTVRETVTSDSEWNANAVISSAYISHETLEFTPPTSHKRKSRATNNAGRKAKRTFLSDHRRVQSYNPTQDGESHLASFLLGAPCVEDEGLRRLPEHGTETVNWPVYEGCFSVHAESEQDVVHNMHALSPPAPHSKFCFSLDPIGDCGQSCLITRTRTTDYDELFSLSHDDNLREYRKDKHNLILDSVNPSVAPHIVISPPDFPYDGYWAYVQNGIGPQSDGYFLTVPPTVSGRSLVWPPRQDRHYAWHTAQYTRHTSPGRSRSPSSPSLPIYPQRPRAIFNLIRFDNKIQAASEERLVMYHVIPSLHRIHFKAAAILTSIVAFEFRRRWDMPNFNSGFEKPFQWTDEAEPLLALHSRNPRSIIIDSVHPCTIPHVVITQAPPQDPWEALVSNTVNPQDCGYGYYLTVPSPLVDFINNYLPDSPLDDDSFMADSDGYESEGLSESESISDDDSPMLLTPPGQAIEFDDAAVTDGCIPATSPNFPLCDDDDDDDDLPPFDDWYLDIAQRASLSSPV